MFRNFLLTATFILGCVFVAGIAKAETIPNAAVEAVQLTEQERICFEMINALRERSGLSPFVLSPDLIDQSRRWSANLQSRGYLYHGAAPEICAQTNTDGAGSGERAFHLWNNSPPHRAFLYRSATTVGIGNAGNFWTMRGESAVYERSESVVRERSSGSSSANGLYYVPSGERPPDSASEEWWSAYTVERTTTSSTRNTYQPRQATPSVFRYRTR